MVEIDRFKELKNDYQKYKAGRCSKEYREKLAKQFGEVMLIISYNGYSQSDILSYIIGDDVEYDEVFVNKIIADIRYQGSEIIVPTPEIPEWRPCLVGNIIDEHEYGETREIRRGTKHFGPGAKVFVAPAQWGDGYERVFVIGKPRHGKNLIQVIMPISKITNFRAQRVYSPTVLQMMQKPGVRWWGNDKETLDMLNEFSRSLNDSNFKYGITERTKKVKAVLKNLSNKYIVSQNSVSKKGQVYPIVNIQASEFAITVDYYGYVNEDASAYIERYYQKSAEEIAERIDKQIESYEAYLISTEQRKFFESTLNGTYEMSDYSVEIDHISDNPIIQAFYERWYKGKMTDDEWLNLRDEILEYMDKKGTEQDFIDLKEFMESLVMLCEGIEEDRLLGCNKLQRIVKQLKKAIKTNRHLVKVMLRKNKES